MEIFKNFGIDPILLGAQIVNFLIIFFILKRFMLKPVMNVLKNRQTTIQTGLKNAEEGKKILEEALNEEKKILKKAQLESQKLIKEAKTQGEEIVKKSEESAKNQADRILKEAKEDITQEIKSAEKNLSIYVSKLAVQFLEKSVSDLFGQKEQEEILTKAMKKLKEKQN